MSMHLDIYFNEGLIDLVRDKPEIWDPKSPNHRNRELVKRSWEEIAVVLNTNPEHAKTRWRTIRDRFIKEEKKVYSGATGSGASSAVKWPLLEQLMFLKPTVEPRKTVTNYTPPTLCDMLGMDDQEIYDEITITSGAGECYEVVDDPGSGNPPCSSPSSSSPSSRKGTRQQQHKENTSFEAALLQQLASSSASKEYTAEELFFLSFAKDTATLGLAARLRIRQKCIEALATEVERQSKLAYLLDACIAECCWL